MTGLRPMRLAGQAPAPERRLTLFDNPTALSYNRGMPYTRANGSTTTTVSVRLDRTNLERIEEVIDHIDRDRKPPHWRSTRADAIRWALNNCPAQPRLRTEA